MMCSVISDTYVLWTVISVAFVAWTYIWVSPSDYISHSSPSCLASLLWGRTGFLQTLIVAYVFLLEESTKDSFLSLFAYGCMYFGNDFSLQYTRYKLQCFSEFTVLFFVFNIVSFLLLCILIIVSYYLMMACGMMFISSAMHNVIIIMSLLSTCVLSKESESVARRSV